MDRISSTKEITIYNAETIAPLFDNYSNLCPRTESISFCHTDYHTFDLYGFVSHLMRACASRTRTVYLFRRIRIRGPFGMSLTGIRVIRAHVDGETWKRMRRRPTSLEDVLCGAK